MPSKYLLIPLSISFIFFGCGKTPAPAVAGPADRMQVATTTVAHSARSGCSIKLDPTGAVNDLYVQYLGRDAHPIGLKGWTENLANGRPIVGNSSAMRETIVFGNESSALGGLDATKVISLYQSTLCRKANQISAADIRGWVSYLRQHKLPAVAARFFASPEFTGNICPDPLARMYRALLGREPSYSEIQGAMHVLASGSQDIFQISANVRNSSEYRANGGVEGEQVIALYRVLLGRFPDQSGLRGWANEVKARRMSLAQVSSAIQSSYEFTQRSCQ